MSNVRPRAIQMRSMLVHKVELHRSAVAEGSCSGRFVKQQLRCIGAGRPSVGGRRTASLCHGFLQHRLGLSVLWRPAHQRFSSKNMQRPNGSVCLAAAPWVPRGVDHSLSWRVATHGANNEHECQPCFAQRCGRRPACRRGCAANQNQGKARAHTREA